MHRRTRSNDLPKLPPLQLSNLQGDNSSLLRTKIEAKLRLKESFTTRADDVSKISTTFRKNTTDDLLTLRDFASLQTSIQSSRSSTKLPVLSRNSSVSQKGFGNMLLLNNIKSHNCSPRISLFSSPLKAYEKITVNSALDFTSPDFLKQLKRIFAKLYKGSKIPMSQGRLRRFVSANSSKRVIESLERDLKALKRPKHLDSMISMNNLDKKKIAIFHHKTIENLDSAVTEMLIRCEESLNQLKSKEELDEFFREMIEIAKESENSELVLYCFYTQAKLAKERGDIKEAIDLFKQYKNICVAHEVYQNKIYAYRNIGKCYQMLRKNYTAITYFTKLLQMAWYTGSVRYELLAYDLIGIQYYYLGLHEKAAFFHNKSASGKIEPKHSSLRQVGIKRLHVGKDSAAQKNFYQVTDLFSLKKKQKNEEEVSSLEEAIDLSLLRNEESNKNETGEIDVISNQPSRREIRKKKMDRFVAGLCRAEIIKQHQESSSIRTVPGKSKMIKSNNCSQIIEEQEEKAGDNNKAPIFEEPLMRKLILTHLSRNRSSKNFAFIGPQNIISQTEGHNLVLSEVLGAGSLSKIKLILEKFRTNILAIKQSLEVCGIESEESLSQIF